MRDDPSLFEAPPFWKSTVEEVEAFFATCHRAEVRQIGKSSGGRPVLAAAYGPKEVRERRMSFSAAVTHKEPGAYFGARRQRPALLIASTIHGAEVEGTVTCLNFASVLETGHDLRGEDWPRLAELAASFRVVIMPLMNPDGRARVPVKHLAGADLETLCHYGIGRRKDGTLVPYDGPYGDHPLRQDDLEFMGGYFNDRGVNLLYDDFLGDRCPETDAFLSLARDEAPDCVLNLHSCGTGPFFNPGDQYVPEAFRHRQTAFSEVVAARLRAEELRPRSNRPALRDLGFCLYNVWHLVCGALPLTFEFPHGYAGKPFTHDEILDIGLITLEEVMSLGLYEGFLPQGWKW